jgi:hypothetical protein
MVTTQSLLLQSDGYFLIGAVDVPVMSITDLGDEKSEKENIGRRRLEHGMRLGHNLASHCTVGGHFGFPQLKGKQVKVNASL